MWDRQNQGQDDLVKARTGWLIGLLINNALEADQKFDAETILKETEELIDRSKLPLSLKEIQFLRLCHRVGKNRDQFFDLKDQLITLAHQIEDLHMRASAISKIADELSTREAQHPEIPVLINEAQKILGDPENVPSPIDAETFLKISTVLGVLGQQSEHEIINKNLDVICISKRMRDLCADVYYGFGLDLIRKDDFVAAERAIPYFLKTRDFGEQLQDPDLLAASYYGLNEAYNGTKHFDAAIPYGKKAAIIFEELKMPEWAASALKNLAESYRLNHQPELALDAAEKVVLRLGKFVVFSGKPWEGGSCFLTPKDIVLSARSSCFMSAGIFPIR